MLVAKYADLEKILIFSNNYENSCKIFSKCLKYFGIKEAEIDRLIFYNPFKKRREFEKYTERKLKTFFNNFEPEATKTQILSFIIINNLASPTQISKELDQNISNVSNHLSDIIKLQSELPMPLIIKIPCPKVADASGERYKTCYSVNDQFPLNIEKITEIHNEILK